MARHYTLRVQHKRVIITVPTTYSIDTVNKLLDTHATEVATIAENQADLLLREGLTFESEFASIYIERSNFVKTTLCREENKLTIKLSRTQDETTEHCQVVLIKTAEAFFKKLGKERVSSRLSYWSKQMNINPESFKLGKAKRSWGNCNTLHSITISVYATLLPAHLLDYLLIHELAHIPEMNHSDRFWAIVDQYTEGKAATLRNELKGYNTSIVQFKRPQQ